MLHQPRPQPPLDFATTLMIDHPGQAMPEDEQQVLLPDNAPAEAFQGYDLDVLAYTATQQYFELAREESELDVWRRNANGPPPAAVPRTFYRLFSYMLYVICSPHVLPFCHIVSRRSRVGQRCMIV